MQAVTVRLSLQTGHDHPTRTVCFSDVKYHLYGRREVTIGRSSHSPHKNLTPSASNLYFDSKVMSRDHAVLRQLDDGHLALFDLSKYGTFLNGEKVTPRTQRTLANGDVLKFGAVLGTSTDDVRLNPVKATIYYSPVERLVHAPAPGHTTSSYSVPDDDDDVLVSDGLVSDGPGYGHEDVLTQNSAANPIVLDDDASRGVSPARIECTFDGKCPCPNHVDDGEAVVFDSEKDDDEVFISEDDEMLNDEDSEYDSLYGCSSPYDSRDDSQYDSQYDSRYDSQYDSEYNFRHDPEVYEHPRSVVDMNIDALLGRGRPGLQDQLSQVSFLAAPNYVPATPINVPADTRVEAEPAAPWRRATDCCFLAHQSPAARPVSSLEELTSKRTRLLEECNALSKKVNEVRGRRDHLVDVPDDNVISKQTQLELKFERANRMPITALLNDEQADIPPAFSVNPQSPSVETVQAVTAAPSVTPAQTIASAETITPVQTMAPSQETLETDQMDKEEEQGADLMEVLATQQKAGRASPKKSQVRSFKVTKRSSKRPSSMQSLVRKTCMAGLCAAVGSVATLGFLASPIADRLAGF